MKIVYIAHPISGDVKGNLKKIVKIVRSINLSMPDIVPLAPYYVDLLALDDNTKKERARGIQNDIAILKSGAIKEVWLYGNRISIGMGEEIKLARKLGIEVIGMTMETRKELFVLQSAKL